MFENLPGSLAELFGKKKTPESPVASVAPAAPDLADSLQVPTSDGGIRQYDVIYEKGAEPVTAESLNNLAEPTGVDAPESVAAAPPTADEEMAKAREQSFEEGYTEAVSDYNPGAVDSTPSPDDTLPDEQAVSPTVEEVVSSSNTTDERTTKYDEKAEREGWDPEEYERIKEEIARIKELRKKVGDSYLTEEDRQYINAKWEHYTELKNNGKAVGIVQFELKFVWARIQALHEYAENESNWNWRWSGKEAVAVADKTEQARIKQARIDRLQDVLRQSLKPFPQDQWYEVQEIITGEASFANADFDLATSRKELKSLLRKQLGVVDVAKITEISLRFFDRKNNKFREGVKPAEDEGPVTPDGTSDDTKEPAIAGQPIALPDAPGVPSDVAGNPGAEGDPDAYSPVHPMDKKPGTEPPVAPTPPEEPPAPEPPTPDRVRQDLSSLICEPLIKTASDERQWFVINKDEPMSHHYLLEKMKTALASAVQDNDFWNIAYDNETSKLLLVLNTDQKQKIEQYIHDYEKESKPLCDPIVIEEGGITKLYWNKDRKSGWLRLPNIKVSLQNATELPDGTIQYFYTGPNHPDNKQFEITKEDKEKLEEAIKLHEDKLQKSVQEKERKLKTEMLGRLTDLVQAREFRGLFTVEPAAMEAFIESYLLEHVVNASKKDATPTQILDERINCLSGLFMLGIQEQHATDGSSKIVDTLFYDKMRVIQLNAFMDRVYGSESGKNAVVNWNADGTQNVYRKNEPQFDAEWAKVPKLNTAQRLFARMRNVFTNQGVPTPRETSFDESVVGAGEQRPREKKHTLRKLTYAGLAVLLLTVGGYKALGERSVENSQQGTAATAQVPDLTEDQATSVFTEALGSEQQEILANAVAQGEQAEVSIGPDGVTVKTGENVVVMTPGEVDKMIAMQEAGATDTEKPKYVEAEPATAFERGAIDRANLTERVTKYWKSTESDNVEENAVDLKVSTDAIVDSFVRIIQQARTIDPSSQTTVQKLFLSFADTNKFVTNSDASYFLVKNVEDLLSVNITDADVQLKILDARWQANHQDVASLSQEKIDEITSDVVPSVQKGAEDLEPVAQQSENKEEQSFLQQLRAEDVHFAEKEAAFRDSMRQKLESEPLYNASPARQMFVAIVEGNLSPEKNEESRALLELIHGRSAEDFNADAEFGWLNREMSVQFPGYMKCYLSQLNNQGQVETLVNTLRFLADGTNRPGTWMGELLTRLDYQVEGNLGSSQQLIADINALAESVESGETDSIQRILARFGIFTQPVQDEWNHLLGQ